MATLTPTIRVVDADGQPVTGDAANLTLSVITDGIATAYSGDITEVVDGEYSVEVTQAGTLQSVSGVSSTSGAIVIPARWQNSPAVGSNVVTLTVEDGDGAPVGSCPVRVSNSGGQLLGYGLTNSATGVVVFNLDAGEYIVTLGPLANYAPNNPHALTVAGDTTADLTVTAISLPVPTSPDCYLLYAQERKADNGDAAFGAGEMTVKVLRIEFPARLDSAASSVRTVVGKEYQTDANGVWSFELAKTAFSAGALLVLQRTWEDDEGNPDSEIWQVTLDDAAATVDDQICLADLAIRRGQ